MSKIVSPNCSPLSGKKVASISEIIPAATIKSYGSGRGKGGGASRQQYGLRVGMGRGFMQSPEMMASATAGNRVMQ